MTFSNSDLLLPDSELTQLTTALANTGIPDPLGSAIAEATDTVADYTARYTITDSRRKRLIRPLVHFALYSLLGQVPDAVQKAYDAAMLELKDIRDGKFADLPAAEDPPTPAAAGKWGSRKNVLPESGTTYS